MTLKISKTLELPDDAVTQTFAILAKRGVGKTYTAKIFVEEMRKNNLHVAVIDPIGVWWGLRSSADGKKAGLSIIVLGGEHGDLPLEPTNGAIIADLIVERGVSVVIDLSLMRKGEQKRFMIDFAEELYHKNRKALHVVLDEADEFAPQRPMGDDARMLGAIEDLVRRGRAKGIGMTMITQRPAVLNKNVLTQIEVLVAMRLTSPQDRAAIGEWVKSHADAEQATEMLASLPSLPIGTAWFWSPGWLELFQKAAIRTSETLDSSSTPKVGEKRIEPTKVAEIDLGDLREQLAATIKQAEERDPKKLQARVKVLERQLADQKPQVEMHQVEIVPPDLPRLVDAVVEATTDAANKSIALREYCRKFAPATDTKKNLGKLLHDTIDAAPEDTGPYTHTFRGDGMVHPDATIDTKLSKAARTLLGVLAQFPAGRTKQQLSLLSGYSIKSSSFEKACSELRTAGYVSPKWPLVITGEGKEIAAQELGEIPPAPVGQALLSWWSARIGLSERTILNVLAKAYPDALSYDEIAEASGYSRTSSSFEKALSRLRTLELANGGAAEGMKASDVFFEGES